MRKVNVMCPGGGTGIALYNLNLIKSLKKRFSMGFNLYTSKDYEFPEVKQSANIICLTNKFYSDNTNKYVKKIGTLAYVILFYIKFLLRLINQKEVIIYQRSFYYIDYMFNVLLRSNKKILIVHDVIPLSFVINKKLDLFFLKLSYKTYNEFIVHSYKNKKELHEKFGIPLQKIHVIEHGVTIAKKVSKEKCIGFFEKNKNSKNKKNILFFGVVRKNKGINVLLEAFKNMNREKYHLIIAGKGNQKISRDVYEFIDTNKLHEDITFINRYIEEDEIPVLFDVADLNVLPYIYFHSQSGVLSQAISYAVPVVVTDVGAMRECVDKYNIGLVVQPKNVEDLRQGLVKGLQSECFKMYHQNLEVCQKELLWENVVLKYKDLIGE